MSQNEELGELRAHVEHLREGQERLERQMAAGFAAVSAAAAAAAASAALVATELRGLLTPIDTRLGAVERDQAEARGHRRAALLVFTTIQGALAAMLAYIWRMSK